MKNSNGFYIGWQEKMADGNKSFLRKMLLPLFVLLPILVVAVVLFQKPFNNHYFEFGTQKEITGVYYDLPVPILVADEGILPDSLSNTILIVGFGKIGAASTLQEIEAKGKKLVGKRITLRGILIYGDGKTLLELTEGVNALVEIKEDIDVLVGIPESTSSVQLQGEILDPKCFFGVMKPGEGKIHKSCAIRCISGGIPPVFRSAKNNEYYIVLGKKGHSINQQILPYVGQKMQMKGQTTKFLGWNILYLDSDNLPIHTIGESEMCKSKGLLSSLQ